MIDCGCTDGHKTACLYSDLSIAHGGVPLDLAARCSRDSWRGEIPPAVERWIAEDGGRLLISGPTGSGKTHLSIVAFREVLLPGRWLKGGTFAREIAAGPERETALIDDLLMIDLVVLDDCGPEILAGDWTRAHERLYYVLSSRAEESLPTIVTTTMDRHEIESDCDPRLARCLLSGDFVVRVRGDIVSD